MVKWDKFLFNTFLVLVGIGIVFGLLALSGVVKVPQQAISPTTPLTPTELQQAVTDCGSTKQTTVTLTLQNALNTSATETFDSAGYYIYKVNSDASKTQVKSGTDTTAGEVTLDCGAKYNFKMISGASTNARVTAVYTNNAEVEADGSVSFITSAPSLTLGMKGSKHATPVVRAYDENARARMYNAGSADTITYQGTGVQFTSTVNNATRTSVTAGSDFIVTMEIKNSGLYADYNDFGVYVLIDSATSSYWDNVQSISFDGQPLADVKGSLNIDESRGLSAYRYVYKIPAGMLMDSKIHKLTLDMLKASGSSGNNDLSVDFAVVGNYLSVDGYSVKTASNKDTSTQPLVFALFQTDFLVSD